MADIESGIQGVIQSLQPSPINYTDQNNLQNQQVQEGNINIANALRQQQVANASAKLYSQTLNQAMTSDPNSIEHKSAIYNLMALNPQFAEAGKATLGQMSEDAQNQHIQDTTAFHGYVTSPTPDYDSALNLANSIKGTDAKEGKDTTVDDQVINLTQRAKSGDPNAAKQLSLIAGTNLASVLGADKYASYVKLPADVAATQANAAKATAETNTLIPAQAAQAQGEANKANFESTPTGVVVPTNSGESVLVNPKTGQQITNVDQTNQQVTAANSADAALHSFMGSEFNPNGSNDQQPRLANGQVASSAKGPSQAVDSTWIQSLAQNHPEMFKGMSQTAITRLGSDSNATKAFIKTPQGQALIAQKTDPQLAQETASNINKSNINALATQYNLPPTYALAAMAYKLGPAGAEAVAKSPDATPLSKLLSPEALKANPTIANLNVGQYEQLIHAQVAKSGADPNTPISVNDPTATGQTLLQTLPTGQQAQIKAILAGDEQPPSQRGDTSPTGMRLEGLLTRIDPNYTNNRYQLKQDLYDTSKPESTGSQIHALNNLIGHTYDYAMHSIERNSNSGVAGNMVGNVAASMFNNSGQTNQINNKLVTDRSQIVGEANKLYGENTELATKIGEKKLNISDDTPTQLSNANEITSLAKTKLANMMQQFNQGTRLPANPSDFLTPANRIKLQHLEQLNAQQNHQPNQQAVALLKQNAHALVPGTNQTYAQKFDQTYGPGSSSKFLQ